MTLRRACVVLLFVLVIATIPVAIIAERHFGAVGRQAALAAAVVCGLAGLSGLAAISWLTPHNRLGAVYASMVCRTGIPLVGGAVLYVGDPSLARAGILESVIVLFLITLLVETILSVAIVTTPRSGKSQTTQTPPSGHHG